MVNEPSVFEPLKFYCICIPTDSYCNALLADIDDTDVSSSGSSKIKKRFSCSMGEKYLCFLCPRRNFGGILKSNRPSVSPLQIVSQRYLINY